MYATDVAINHVELVTDVAGDPLLGAVAGDFSPIEAYLVTNTATTAVVTLTELNQGEYRFTFTPSVLGTWRFHALHTSTGGQYGESFVVDVLGAGATIAASAGMYTTVAIVRARLGITGSAQDDAIESVINAASREIDGLCGGRFFYQLAATTRYFKADDSGILEIDDLVSVTSITSDDDGDRTYETTWASTDYDLEPYNAADHGFPYTSIQTTPAGRYAFPSTRKGVAITGTWGWPSVPYAIAEACVLQSVRLFKRKDAPYGLAGSAELGQQTFVPGKVDPQVQSLVAPMRRFFIGAV